METIDLDNCAGCTGTIYYDKELNFIRRPCHRIYHHNCFRSGIDSNPPKCCPVCDERREIELKEYERKFKEIRKAEREKIRKIYSNGYCLVKSHSNSETQKLMEKLIRKHKASKNGFNREKYFKKIFSIPFRAAKAPASERTS